jgi:hypothetical protein
MPPYTWKALREQEKRPASELPEQKRQTASFLIKLNPGRTANLC